MSAGGLIIGQSKEERGNCSSFELQYTESRSIMETGEEPRSATIGELS